MITILKSWLLISPKSYIFVFLFEDSVLDLKLFPVNSMAKESKDNTCGNGYIGAPAYPNVGCVESSGGRFRD